MLFKLYPRQSYRFLRRYPQLLDVAPKSYLNQTTHRSYGYSAENDYFNYFGVMDSEVSFSEIVTKCVEMVENGLVDNDRHAIY